VFKSSGGLLTLLVLCLLSASVVAGCGGSDGGGAAGGGGEGSSESLTVGRASEVTSLDPQQISTGQDIITQSALFDALVKPTADFQGMEPRLATSMEAEEGSRTYTFSIPPDLEFSDGSPLTSADVKFSINWAKKGTFYGPMLTSISSVRTPDPQTIEVRLSQPDSLVLPGLAHAFIVPKGFGGQEATEFFKRPVSSGPFELESWNPGQEMELVRNEAFRDPAPLRSVLYRVISDSNARINAFQAGEIQLNEYVPEEQIDQIEQDTLIEVDPSSRLVLAVTNNTEPPFDDVDVREAFSLALDRQALLESVWRGNGEPLRGLLPPGVPHAVGVPGGEATWSHDLARARQLLQSSSHPGASFTLVTAYDRGINSTVTDAMQNQLTQAGFKVEIEVVDFATLIDRLLGKQFKVGMLTNGAYLPTAGEGLITYASLYPPVAGWDADEAAEFVADYRNAASDADRDDAARRFESWAHEDFLATPVGAPFVHLARDPSIDGLEVTPAATYSLGTVRVG
jgi:peptide/nickel transport system substrate-binding protein